MSSLNFYQSFASGDCVLYKVEHVRWLNVYGRTAPWAEA